MRQDPCSTLKAEKNDPRENKPVCSSCLIDTFPLPHPRLQLLQIRFRLSSVPGIKWISSEILFCFVLCFVSSSSFQDFNFLLRIGWKLSWKIVGQAANRQTSLIPGCRSAHTQLVFINTPFFIFSLPDLWHFNVSRSYRSISSDNQHVPLLDKRVVTQCVGG